MRRALLSVSDKTGLSELVEALLEHNPEVELLSTGGTASWIREAGHRVVDMASYTEFPEAFGGRVKTVHPKILGGILYRRGRDEEEALRLGIPPIDLVAVNLYPFTRTFEQGADEKELVEQIDIGGVTLLRAGAKASDHVVILCRPQDYESVTRELTATGDVSLPTRRALRARAFAHSAEYDAHIAACLGDSRFPQTLSLPCQRAEALRYGENPHQQAAAYRLPFHSGLARYQQLHGKELSYTNLLDVAAGWRAARDAVATVGEGVACSVIKHAGPCGLAVDHSGLEAFLQAWSCDPKSAFGSIVTLTRTVDLRHAEAILDDRFVEVVVATGFTDEALERLRARPSLRLVKIPGESGAPIPLPFQATGILEEGLLLLQTPDEPGAAPAQCPTRAPFPEDKRGLAAFCMSAARHLKSNSIAIGAFTGTGYRTVGLGGGQPSRVDSVRLALERSREIQAELGDCVLASDAFFPFPDSIELAAQAGVRYVVQPGGSVRDREVVEACDRLGVAMLLTGRRHFRH
ncbi:MAG: bifunctional phosphoribosylaminoimidazolecarboxamide formyltransferase/IMP cyclohydrolase [Armatimonadetes bacterium]|nr:bifunctional phosphoribosylaminoimidazolecarboxamide formyltransferase/IMP cyclohydrolase [Armatimonadota bacterium]